VTHSLVNSMKVNIPIQRNVITDISWKDFLDQVNSVFPGILLCSHVCKARANHHEVFFICIVDITFS